jgi:uncharacterized damage-inducible protein DinB
MSTITNSVRYEYPFPEGSLLKNLESQREQLENIFSTVSEQQAGTSYSSGKWTLKELLGHMIDTERILNYRALCIARGEKASLPGFEEDEYVAAADFNLRSLSELLEDYRIQRKATQRLFSSFTEEMLQRAGTANKRPMTPQIILGLITGHEAHHINIIQERYLPVLV